MPVQKIFTIGAAILSMLASVSDAQTSDPPPVASLEQARASLQQLDGMAADCMAQDRDPESCNPFRIAINGDLLDAYLENCRVAREWRDRFVTEQVAAGDQRPATNDSQALLGYLVDIEYLCGENALVRATEFVVPAYRSLGRIDTAAGLEYRLDSWRQQQLQERERTRQKQAVSSQERRRQQQTTQQFERLELELIRQQTQPRYPR
ncbi:MAG: hypothetical protein R3F41_12380 [Gammaproteobacteria bacterium]|nr:hypothetical protein [Pseudomonadales bacterium]